MSRSIPIPLMAGAVGAVLGLGSCQMEDPAQSPYTYYDNPVLAGTFEEPAVVRAENGTFWLYGAQEGDDTPIWSSPDLVTWTREGSVFLPAGRPDFLADGVVAAPSVHRIGGQYVYYYSLKGGADAWNYGIGAATAPAPEGPWTDRGAVFTSADTGIRNTVDGCLADDGGRLWMFFGDGYGIYALELAADGLSLAAGAVPVKVAGNAFRGSVVCRHRGYWYLFVTTADGLAVGMASAVTGPYLSRDGGRMLSNAATTVAGSNSWFTASAACSAVITDDSGTDWLLYQAAVRTDAEADPRLVISRLDWSAGWPTVSGGAPLTRGIAPYFTRL